MCLKFITFGLRSTLLIFVGKYFEYGEKVIETKGLTIGGYKSTFFAYLLAFCMLEECNNQFKEFLWKEIYRDDRLLVFEDRKLLFGNRNMEV